MSGRVDPVRLSGGGGRESPLDPSLRFGADLGFRMLLLPALAPVAQPGTLSSGSGACFVCGTGSLLLGAESACPVQGPWGGIFVLLTVWVVGEWFPRRKFSVAQHCHPDWGEFRCLRG